MINPVAFYKCLAEETRLKSLLLISLNGELCVCDLTNALELSQPKISRHLAELRKCEILIDERRGKWVYYKLHPTLPDWARDVLSSTAQTTTDFYRKELSNLKKSLASCC
jgi:ArsR family transcriptional regulator|tara:strand:- start:5745 stop:6074 length:330 start_codon:yes stop_codon:yes gene_type:complete